MIEQMANADVEHLWARFVNHFWGSLEGDKAIVLKHIRAVLDYHEESRVPPHQPSIPDDPVDVVREIIARRKISANKLATSAGIAPSTLNRALNNPKHKFMLSTRTLKKIRDWDER